MTASERRWGVQDIVLFGVEVGGADAPAAGPSDRRLLGGKGGGLLDMSRLGLPVPPGCILTTDLCRQYQQTGAVPADLEERLRRSLARVEAAHGGRFGDPEHPLLVAVRSGAEISMPGMMDTVLNVGLNDEVVEGLARRTGNRRFAFDSYRRLISMYGDVVLGMKPENERSPDPFEVILQQAMRTEGVSSEAELSADALADLVGAYQAVIESLTPHRFPQDPWAQLMGAVTAVFASWNNARAQSYRRIHGIPEDLGTAVNIQAMVFGNMGARSATGVAFTRDPNTGEKRFFGEYLMNAQGEDVVAGIRTPAPLNESGLVGPSDETLSHRMPEVYQRLEDVRLRLERHFRDMQDIEFTVEEDRLWILQTRSGKRSAQAAVRIATDMVAERLIPKEEALLRVTPAQLDQLLHPTLDPSAERTVVGRGLPASPGAATGRLVFTASEAVRRGQLGERVVLARTETSPEDVEGMQHAAAIVTVRGGMTSHAAVVARGMGRTCVVGCGEITLDLDVGELRGRGYQLREDDLVTVDGTSGELLLGEVGTISAGPSDAFETLMGWADEFRRLGVRANADTAEDAARAFSLGAEGIGLCRTEHMFFEDDRIVAMRELIFAEDAPARRKALERVAELQKQDFSALFRKAEGRPVTIRLLDPPLHEFLPHDEAQLEELARAMGHDVDRVKRRVDALREFNPMLGLRGVRLGLQYPEIYDAQVRCILEAAAQLAKEGAKVAPEIMVPLVAHEHELERMSERVAAIAEDVKARVGPVPYLLGTMIELPRAALRAGPLAATASFFSFGTNDLTQMTLGLSRDDSGSFLPDQVTMGIWPRDPFEALDRDGVGELMRFGLERGRSANPALKVGLCGEHGGEASSIEFCHDLGLDYVSCSPFRVPVARLAAAQAAIRRATS